MRMRYSALSSEKENSILIPAKEHLSVKENTIRLFTMNYTTSHVHDELQQRSDTDSINVVFPVDEWLSTKGGLTTFNREFTMNLAKLNDIVKVYCYVPQSSEKEREDARRHGVYLINAEEVPGSEDPIDCLKLPPPETRVDVVVGHGRKFGVPAFFIMKNSPPKRPKWIQMLHVCCEELGKHKKKEKTGQDTIEDNEKKHKNEISLCEAADRVVGVGHRLQHKYKSYLPDIRVESLTPGIFQSYCQPLHSPTRSSSTDESDSTTDLWEFKIFIIGRLRREDLYVKGLDIIAKAVASLGEKFKLTCVGTKAGQQRAIENWCCKEAGIDRDQLTIRGFSDQEELKKMFRQADLVALPSRVEGFGLIALEAISAGVPVLVSDQSGIATALRKVVGGNDVIVSPKEPQKWAERIQQLSLQDPQARNDNALRLRENYQQMYPWEKECNKFVRHIIHLLKADPTFNKDNCGSSWQVQNSNQSGVPPPLPPVRRTLQEKQNRRREVHEAFLDPVLLQREMWWHLCLLFGPQTQLESREMKWGDISLGTDPTTGQEMLVPSARLANQLTAPVRSVESHKSPVEIYKVFKSHRPMDMNNPDSPFYLAVKCRNKPTNQVWYMRRAQAVNKIGTKVNTMTRVDKPGPSDTDEDILSVTTMARVEPGPSDNAEDISSVTTMARMEPGPSDNSEVMMTLATVDEAGPSDTVDDTTSVKPILKSKNLKRTRDNLVDNLSVNFQPSRKRNRRQKHK